MFSRQLLRTSRLALRNNKSVNPVQQALGLQGSARYVQGVRGYAAAFTRDKPHVNIGECLCIVDYIDMSI
jgi:elongation factor Tu